MDNNGLQRALPGHFYVDPELFAAEREKIFLPSWQIICTAEKLRSAGDYVLINVTGVSIIVVRSAAGELRAFQNICRHRGSRLLDGPDGNCDVIRCPYHDWRYALDGTLIETPWFGDPTPFDLSDLSLMPVAIEVWRGLVFVSVKPTETLAAQLGDLPAHLEDANLEGMTEVQGPILRMPVNWKAYLDQFNEYYHTPAVHAPDKTVGIQHYTAIPFQQGMVMQSPPGAAFYGGKWIWSWPNWTISTFAGGAKISRVMPVSASETEVQFLFLFTDMGAETTELRQRVMDATAHIFAEDVAAVKRVQVNMASGYFDNPGPLHPQHEQATAYFQRKVREALT